MSRLRIATWNVNSIRIRLVRLRAWLEQRSPDVLCLQETKVVDESFPLAEIERAGYRAAIFGQKTYNGVAIFAKEEPTDVVCGFADGAAESDARLIAATVRGVRVISAYFPNGSTVGSEKYVYKRAWIARLKAYLERRHTKSDVLALCGDFNVAPEAIDVAFPEAWKDSVLFCDEIRADLAGLRAFGLADSFRRLNGEAGWYSWWDYQMLAFPKNNGLRIDHIDVTEPLARKLAAVAIDRDQRKPSACPEGTKPSDHAPVFADFEL